MFMHYLFPWQESDIQAWLTYAAFPVTNKEPALKVGHSQILVKERHCELMRR